MRWPQCPRSGCCLQEEGRRRDRTGGGDGRAEPHTRTGTERQLPKGVSGCKGADAQTPHIRCRERMTPAQKRWLRVCALGQQDNTTKTQFEPPARNRKGPCLALGPSYDIQPHKHDMDGLEHQTHRRKHTQREETHHHLSLSIMTSISSQSVPCPNIQPLHPTLVTLITIQTITADHPHPRPSRNQTTLSTLSQRRAAATTPDQPTNKQSRPEFHQIIQTSESFPDPPSHQSSETSLKKNKI